MKRATLIIILLQFVAIITLFWVLIFLGRDEYETATSKPEEAIFTPPQVSVENGIPLITLSRASQQQAGIATAPLPPSAHDAHVSSFGTVVSLDTLIDLRTRYLSARSDADAARGALAHSKREHARLAQLNLDNRNISDRAVAIAEAAMKADAARLAASEGTAGNVRDAMRQQWGETFAAWATQHASGNALHRLLRQDDVLLQIMLPIRENTPGQGARLAIRAAGSNAAPIQATFVSAAPHTDPTIQGKTFFYSAPAGGLRAGMRVTATLSDQKQRTQGLVVPASAIVWFANQAWAYQKQGDNRFVRRPVKTDVETAEGWFNPAGYLNPGDEVVVTGAQLLLSEEFKHQITNENED